jgi:hypothetical protein
MLLRLNEVFAAVAQAADERLLKGIKAKVRRAVKERGDGDSPEKG